MKGVDVTVDLLPERRVATIENAWVPNANVRPGDEVPVKVFLRPYRGERIERDFTVKIPPGLAKGDHRILLSDADTVTACRTWPASMNRYIDLPETVSLINQERSNNKLYVSLVESSPDGLLRRQDAAQPAVFGAERDAGRAHGAQSAGDLAGERLRADVAAVRLRGERQLLAAHHGEVNIVE